MPLDQRVIEPFYICRDILPDNYGSSYPKYVSNELECVANGSMANVIRQLSSLSSYAEDIFSGILDESKLLLKKTELLQKRIDKLCSSVTSLDSQLEEFSFTDLKYDDSFENTKTYDQDVLSRQTMSSSLLKKYLMCDRPPPLDKLNCYRDDGKDALKFYTDPNYFFDLWKKEMLKETEKEKYNKKIISNNNLDATKQIEENHYIKHNKKPRKPENTTEKYRKLMSQQEFFADSNAISQKNRQNYRADEYSPYGTIEIPLNREVENKPINVVDGKNFYNNDNQYNTVRRQSRPINPPPAPPSIPESINHQPTENHVRFSQKTEIIPNSPVLKNDTQINMSFLQKSMPPPPPPLPPAIPGILTNNNSQNKENIIKPQVENSIQSSSLAQEILKKQRELRHANLNPKTTTVDPRSSLLASIREGIKLRSVQQHKKKQVEKEAPLHDVASILARRVAMQLSDSESNHSNNESEDDWEDGN